MQRLRVLTVLLVFLGGAAPAAPVETGAPAEEAAEQVVPINRSEPGSLFPALKLKVLQPGAKTLEPIDLGGILGQKPVVFVYFVLGEAISEEAFLDVQRLAGEVKDDVAFFGAIKMGRRFSLDSAIERLSLFGATLPVIVEEELVLAGHLGITTAPSISLIDHRGIYKVPDAKSLKQEVVRNIDMEKAILNAARRGPVPQSLRLPRYYPASELVGEQFPDFILKKFQSDERVKLSDQVREGRVLALLFWHPNCKQCKTAMPGIVVGANSYAEWLDVVSVTVLKNADEERNAVDTIRAHKMEFPVLEDEGKRVSDLYKVLSTPTVFIIRPDGVVDSVYTSGDVSFVPIFSARIRHILKVGREYEGGP